MPDASAGATAGTKTDALNSKDALNSITGLLQYSTGIVLVALAFSLSLPTTIALLAHTELCDSRVAWAFLILAWLAFLLGIFQGILAWARVIGSIISATDGPADKVLVRRAMWHLSALGIGLVAVVVVVLIGALWEPAVSTATQATAIAFNRIDPLPELTEKKVELVTFSDAHAATWHISLTAVAKPVGHDQGRTQSIEVFIEPESGDVRCVPAQKRCALPVEK